jgi:hypothetical protein
VRRATLLASNTVLLGLLGLGLGLALAPAARAGVPPVTAQATFSPLVHAFADPVTATVTVAVEPSLVDPASVRVDAHFAPYRARLLRVERSSASGGTVVVRRLYRLSCATAACVPKQPERSFQVAPARISWRTPSGTPQSGTVAWPPLTVASRISSAELSTPDFRAAAAPPAPGHRIAPATLGVALVALGGVLAGAGLATLLLLALRRRRRPVAAAPLQRALELVEQASRGDVVERRRALYQLALVLEEARLEPESWAARKLAWAPATPDPDGMQMLSLVIREQLQEAM